MQTEQLAKPIDLQREFLGNLTDDTIQSLIDFRLVFERDPRVPPPGLRGVLEPSFKSKFSEWEKEKFLPSIERQARGSLSLNVLRSLGEHVERWRSVVLDLKKTLSYIQTKVDKDELVPIEEVRVRLRMAVKKALKKRETKQRLRRQYLPRLLYTDELFFNFQRASDELRSQKEACEWLKAKFPGAIKEEKEVSFIRSYQARRKRDKSWLGRYEEWKTEQEAKETAMHTK